MKLAAAILVSLAGAACQPGFSRTEMAARQWGGEPLFTDEDVRRVEQLKPQAAAPLRLAVVPPLEPDAPGSREGELALLEAWGASLKQAGLVSELVVVPRVLVGLPVGRQRPADYLKAARIAAARVGADAVLLLSCVTESSRSVNPLCLLDLTIVGAFLAPGHTRNGLTLIEAVVLDNRNEYVYWAGTVEGTGTTTAPIGLIDEADAVSRSRHAAMKALGGRLAGIGARLQPADGGR